MNNSNQLQEFIALMNRLEKVYSTLPDAMATVAVNFSKDRFRQQNWVDVSTKPWRKRKHDTDPGRAVLVGKGSGKLKRDVHKIVVTPQYAIIGTSNLTGKYAKAHNEGYRGTVSIKQHSRNRFANVKEKYKTKNGNERSRTVKRLSDKPVIIVKAHTRSVNLVARQFLGHSIIMDKQIERMVAAKLIKAINKQI